MAFTRFTKNVLNVSALPDRVQNQAQTLKATFDQAGVDIKAALNALITELEASTSAGNIGADVSSVTTKTVQAILTAFEEEIANRYTKNEIDTLVSGNTNDLVADVDINLTTGVITVTKKDGTVEKFDTAIEKVPAKFEIVESGTSLFLKITNVDGTSTQTNITELMNIYDFSNTNDIAFNVSGTGNEKVVTANIRPNSIGLDKLSLSVMTTLEGYMTSARDSANAAKISEANARNSANTATRAAEKASIAEGLANTAIKKATEAESYAHGGTGTREGEDTDNAKYYSQVAKEVAGGDFVTSTEMEAYAQKKGTAPSFEGTELSGETIETDVPLEMESALHISGNSEQDSRSGKSLVDMSLFDTMSVSSTSNTYDTANHIITMNADSSSDSAGRYVNLTAFTSGATYTISFDIRGTSGKKVNCGMDRARVDITLSDEYVRYSKTFTATAERMPIVFYSKSLSNGGLASGEYMQFANVMITADGSTEYEPYGVQPSPDYPSEIRSVKSKSDNLFDMDSWTIFDKQEDGSYKANTTLNTSAKLTLSLPVDEYTFSYYLKCAAGDDYRVRVYYKDGTNKDNRFLSNGEFVYITLTTEAKEIDYISFNYASSANSNVYIKDFMLNKGTEALPYQPYGYVPVEAKVEGKNLAEMLVPTSTSGGITYSVQEDGSVIANGTSTATSYYYSTISTRLHTIPKGTYTVSCFKEHITNMQIKILGEGSEELLVTASSPKTITFEEDTQYRIGLRVPSGVTLNNFVFYPQIERGTTATPYTPHVSPKTISLPLGDIELRSTPDGTRDAFERVDGAWNKVSNIGNVVLDGVNNAFESKSSTQRNTIWMSTATYESNKDASVMSNRFKGANSLLYENDGIGIYTENNRIKCAFGKNSDLTTLELANAWLASNPTQVDYVLATPTYTPITDEALIQALDELEQLILHKGYNRITVTGVNGVKAYLDLSIPSTASVTNVEATESSAEMIVPVVVGEGDVIPKIPKEENQIKLDLSTGLVKVKDLEINGERIVTKEYVDTQVDTKADASHTQAASSITAGTLAGQVVANATAVATLTDSQVRNIKAQTTDLTAGTSALATGDIVFVYE